MSSPEAFHRHDHTACVASALAAADPACAARRAHFTPVRRRTLEILLEAHAAMGAYDVLERLAAEGYGAKPPVAYRALGFLTDQGFAHRIERLNAFIACARPGPAHEPAFLICRACGTVAEGEARGTMEVQGAAAGFVIEQRVIEAEGLCPRCQTDPNKATAPC